MSMTATAQPMPTLFSIAMTDWLPKLGEKAFLAWLQLHSWKNEPSSSIPATLPLSLNRIIKRLKVGNSTFYDHILRPLWNHGLIDILPSQAGKKQQLVLYSFPMNNPEQLSHPLLQIRDYDLNPPEHISKVKEPEISIQQYDVILAETPQSKMTASPDDSIHLTKGQSLSILQEEPSDYLFEVDLNPATSIIKVEKKILQSQPPFILPPALQKEVETNPMLLQRIHAIEEVYERCKDHSSYTDEFFLRKIHICIPYCPDPSRFAAYLYKAIINEWNSPPPSTSPYPKSPKKDSIKKEMKEEQSRPPDVLEWVWRQLQRERNSIKTENLKYTPGQQAIADELLRLLGER